jgi:transposase-like protein
MGLFTTTEDPQLEEARKEVVAGEMVCPSCKQPFVREGATLVAWNGAIGLEGHKCPHCGHTFTVRRPNALDIL